MIIQKGYVIHTFSIIYENAFLDEKWIDLE
jgi:hypothetical protein